MKRLAAFTISVFLLLSLPVRADPANDTIAESNDAFIGAVTVDPSPGTRSLVQLWNPPDSGENLYVDRIEFVHSFNGFSGGAVAASSTVMGAFRENPPNKRLGGPASVAEARGGNMPAANVSSYHLYQIWKATRMDDEGYAFDPAIIVPPGKGLLVGAAHDNTYLIVSFQYREKPAH